MVVLLLSKCFRTKDFSRKLTASCRSISSSSITSPYLEEAIGVSEQAVKVTPKDHPNLAGRLNNLGNKLESRCERIGRIEDLGTKLGCLVTHGIEAM